MRKLAVAFLFCLTSTIANAQERSLFREFNKPVLCGPLETLLKAITGPEYQEMPIWTGRDQDGKGDYMVFVNPKSDTFTIIQFSENAGCIIGMGNSNNFFKMQQNLQTL
jgi:hypothetical protein